MMAKRRRKRPTCAYCDEKPIAKGLCAMHYARKRAGTPMDKPKSRITSKLTEDDVRMIRRLHASGLSLVAIAGHYGLTATSVSNIVHRRTWKHID